MNLQKAFILDGEKLEERLKYYTDLYCKSAKHEEREYIDGKIDMLKELKQHIKPALPILKPLVEDAYNDGINAFRPDGNFEDAEQYYKTKFNKP